MSSARPGRRAALALAALLAFALPSPARGQTYTVGYRFDAVSAPGAFSQIFPGLANGPTLAYPNATFEGGVILSDVLFGNSATSGDNILATCDTCGLGDGPPATMLPGTITATFATPAESVSLDVVNGFGGGPGTFTLTAYDAGGLVVASDAVVAAPSGSPGFVQPLAVSAPDIHSVVVGTDLLPGYTFAVDTVVVGFTPGTWTDLGAALAGTGGQEPLLTGTSSLVPGDRVTLRLSDALPSALAFLVVSGSALNAPFAGGTFVPAPDVLLALGTDGAGGFVASSTWPAGLPGGTDVYVQVWIVDAGGPFGYASSNALAATTP